jgi:elongation factor Ts
VAISATQVKELREKTGAGIMECKRALEEAGGDMNQAAAFLRQQGLTKAEKKGGRAALQGLIEPYIHAGGRIGALVEVNCETDFVARTPDFRTLAHDIAMQVAASPDTRYVSEEEVPEEAWPQIEADFGGRAEALKAVSLLDQVFIKDGRRTIRDLIQEHVAKIGENILVRRFARFELGGDVPSEASTARREAIEKSLGIGG